MTERTGTSCMDMLGLTPIESLISDLKAVKLTERLIVTDIDLELAGHFGTNIRREPCISLNVSGLINESFETNRAFYCN